MFAEVGGYDSGEICLGGMMKIRLNIKCWNSVYYWALLLFVPMEAVGGIIANYGGENANIIGYIYRGIVILLFGKMILKRKNYVYLIASALTLLGVFVNSLIRRNVNIPYDIMSFIRVLYFETLSLGLAESVESNRISKMMLETILKKASVLIMATYFLSFLSGMGISSYSDVGYKAFFNSINSLTIVLIILSSFQLMLFQREGKKKDFVLYGLLSMCLFLSGAKSGIVLWAIYLLYAYVPRRTGKYVKQLMISIMVFSIGIYIYLDKFGAQIDAIISRIVYLSTTSSSNLEFLLSGRNNLLIVGWKEFSEKFTVFDLIFGKGVYNMQIRIGHISGWSTLKSVEMDCFDSLFDFGILGLIVTYYLSFKTVLNSKKMGLDAEFVMFLMCIAFSILGGHIFRDSFGSSILAIIIALNIAKGKGVEMKR